MDWLHCACTFHTLLRRGTGRGHWPMGAGRNPRRPAGLLGTEAALETGHRGTWRDGVGPSHSHYILTYC